eukprot:Gb_09532 [translate_table: standard]
MPMLFHTRFVLVAEKSVLGGVGIVSAKMSKIGGSYDHGDNLESSQEIHEVAQYAVNEYNSKQNSVESLEFSKVVSAKKQVVAGTMHHLVIEVSGTEEKPRLYEAKVWVKPWENFKQLVDFKPVH